MHWSWCRGARVQADGVRWSQRQMEEERGDEGKKKEMKKEKGRQYHDKNKVQLP